MNDLDSFEERLAAGLAAIAARDVTPVDARAVADAAIAARQAQGGRWRRFWLTAAVAVSATAIGLSLAPLFQSHPSANPSPEPTLVAPWETVVWERAAHDPGIGHDPELNQWMGGVVAGGPGYLAWGLDEHRLPAGVGAAMVIWVSSDARTWHEVPFEHESLTRRASVLGMAVGPPGIVAVGGVCCTEFNASGGGIATPARWFSTDGEQWSPEPMVGLRPDPDQLTPIVFGAAGFVEAGVAEGQPAVWFSPDGKTWTGTSLGVTGDSGAINDVTVDASGYLAVGYVGSANQGTAAVWRSADGVSWTRLGGDDPVLGSGRIVRLDHVVAYKGGLFATGARVLPLDQQTCDPGIPRLGPFATPPASQPASPAAQALLAAMVCTTSEPDWLFSADGRHWTELPDPELKPGELVDIHLIRAGGPGLIVIGPPSQPKEARLSTALWTSADGEHWTKATDTPSFGFSARVNGFTVQGDSLVAVGQIGNSAAAWSGRRVPPSAATTLP
jgi:hypothetical protein